MKDKMDRRSFMRIMGTSLGIGALYSVVPALGGASAGDFFASGVADFLKVRNGEAPSPFTFVQLSDPHVGFNGPPDPLGTQAFENAVAMVNQLPRRPDLVIFTGDLTHDAPTRDTHAERMKLFRSIAGRLKVPMLKWVPGENDAALDNGVLYREFFGDTSYSFDHRGVHFVALDNVSRGRPEVGARADRMAQARPRALPKNRADRRVHPSPAIRSETGMGMVHERRRRRDECAGAI